MAKKKILKAQKRSSIAISRSKSKRVYVTYTPKKMEKKLRLKEDKKLIPYSPTEELLDENFIAQAIWECLKNNDPEGVMEIIQAHLRVVNKSKATKEAHLARSSMYNALKGKNPTVKTLAKLVNCCT